MLSLFRGPLFRGSLLGGPLRCGTLFGNLATFSARFRQPYRDRLLLARNLLPGATTF
jgi:hypothetical protein